MSDPIVTKNALLNKLSKPVRDAVLNAAEFVHLDIRENIIEPNKQIKHVDFPEFGVMSVLKRMEDGTLIEIATVGNEGVLGTVIALGVDEIEDLCFCQVEGASWRVDADKFRNLCQEHEELKALILRYSVVYSDQVSRNMGCNRTHSLEERCARWLLMTADRCQDNEFLLTQEFLAVMLGVSRTGVNLAAKLLSEAQLIKYVRGRIRILDRVGLEDVCCQCYFSMRDYANKIMNWDLERK